MVPVLWHDVNIMTWRSRVPGWRRKALVAAGLEMVPHNCRLETDGWCTVGCHPLLTPRTWCRPHWTSWLLPSPALWTSLQTAVCTLSIETTLWDSTLWHGLSLSFISVKSLISCVIFTLIVRVKKYVSCKCISGKMHHSSLTSYIHTGEVTKAQSVEMCVQLYNIEMIL